MKAILVTAFEAFGGETINPTERVLGMLPDETGGYGVRKILLPVEFGRAAEIAVSEYDRLKPAAAIMLGQAGGRSAISPETTARNLMNSSAPDNAGHTADHIRISESGPHKLKSTLPVDSIVDVLSAKGIPCEISDDAGTFVCNDLFYRMLEHAGGEVPAGFIHVPYIREQWHEDKPFMEISDIEAGIEAIMEIVMEETVDPAD